MRSTLLRASALCLFALSTLGCPSTPVEDPPDVFRILRDTGPVEDDAFVVMDDAFIAPDEDAALDASRAPDAHVVPDATFGPPEDAGPCGVVDEDAAISRCSCVTLGADCSVSPCPSGLACVDDGCGMHCQPSGDECATTADCPGGATCVVTDRGMICSRPTPDCGSSRDCPEGYSCDAGSCVDRRIGCTASDFDTTCPFNFLCNIDLGAPFCMRAMPRCQTDANCLSSFVCMDVEGDGPRECVPPGLCDSLSDCTPAEGSCGVEPSRLTPECLPAGLCRTEADCAAGRTCVDLWGDGQRECVEAGGECDAQTDCDAGELCASPYEGGPPRCLDVPLSI